MFQPSVLLHAQKCDATAAESEKICYFQSLRKIIIKVYTITTIDSIFCRRRAAVNDLVSALIWCALRTWPH